jgi:hypothetical protein
VVPHLERAARPERAEPQYELIEPVEGPGSTQTGSPSAAGLYHVAYFVESLERVTAGMEAAGHPAVARIHSFGADGDGAAAYLGTADPLGFLVEAVEPPKRMPHAEFSL